MPHDLLVLHLTDHPDFDAPGRIDSSSLTTRPVTSADRETLATLYLASYPPEVAATDLTEAHAEIDATFAGKFGDLLPTASLIAHLDGSAAGAILTTHRSAWDDFNEPFIIDLFVTPSLHRQGVGHVLVEHAIRAARSAGRTAIGLRVGEGTSQAATSSTSEPGSAPSPKSSPSETQMPSGASSKPFPAGPEPGLHVQAQGLCPRILIR